MTVRRHHSIHAAERSIRAVHALARPYQRYEVLRACERGCWRCQWRNPLKLALAWLPGRRPFRVYTVEDDSGSVLCVAPLRRDGTGWKVVDGDDYVRLNYVDLLYADRPLPELERAFSRLLQSLREDGIARLRISSLAEDSTTHSLLANFPHRELASTPAVAINIPGDWFSYRRSLSANARSNLNKSASRLRRRGKAVGFEFYSNCGMGAALSSFRGRSALRECMDFYCRRMGSRYSHRGWCARMYFMRCNHTSLSMESPDAFLAALRIDGVAAAFMQGYVDARRGSLCVPRLAMNDAFAEYSPGRLLVDEGIRWLCANSELRKLDLTCGDERYKYDLGGVGYSTPDLEISTGGE